MDPSDCKAALGQAHPIAQRLMEVLEAGEPAEVLRACGAAITEFIRSDDILLTQYALNDERNTFVFAGHPLTIDRDLTCELTAHGATHPVIQSYLTLGDDGRPRRASDVVDSHSWRRHPASAGAFREHGGAHQLSMVVTLTAGQGRGWVLTRGSRDFSPSDVDTAGILLPALAVIDRLCNPLPRSEIGVTARELDLLRLLADGLSGRVMARRLGISERTVAKHLEHLYRKLGTHDRVSTIATGQHHGLLSPRAGLGLVGLGTADPSIRHVNTEATR